MKEFEREARYVVFKLKDIQQLSEEQRSQLAAICYQMSIIRAERGKKQLSCVVVEDDWPEYEYVWGLLKWRMGNTK